jgi:8-oxo-dGTP diphosphatase
MSEYVVGFMLESLSDRVIVIRKQKPLWQSGLLNGVGGKIEAGETPIDAMRREFLEEAGFEHHNWRPVAVLGKSWKVHVFAATVRRFPDFVGQPGQINDIGEPIEIVRISELPMRRDLIKNLRWLIPLCFEDPDGPFVAEEELAA